MNNQPDLNMYYDAGLSRLVIAVIVGCIIALIILYRRLRRK
jgi:hypothetical protein